MILDEIRKAKKLEVEKLREAYKGKDVEKLAKSLPRPRDFAAAFKKRKLSLVAEIKKASPSAGIIREKFDPISLAKMYEEFGASAVSVLTDQQFFQGDLSHLKMAKESTVIPILRKDFIIDESQVYESRIAGADAILLIVRILTENLLSNYIALAKGLGMSALVEVHSPEEAQRALKAGAEIIGINNRDLSTFNVDMNTTIKILESVPDLKKKIIVSESGVKSCEDVKRLTAAGVDAILVGETILKSRDVGKKIRDLLTGT